jgi:hypothetical protein
VNVTVDLTSILSSGVFGASMSEKFGECKPVAEPTKNLCANLTISVNTDDFPRETFVDVVDLNTGNIFWLDQVFEAPNKKYDLQQCIDSTGCYEVEIFDSFGDGIKGKGVELTFDNKKVVSGGNFTYLAVYDVGNGCASRPPCKMLKLELTTGNYPQDTGVNLFDYFTSTSVWWEVEFKEKDKKYVMEKCIDPLRCYELSISDYSYYYDGGLGGIEYKLTYDGAEVGSDVAENFTEWTYYLVGDCDSIEDDYDYEDSDEYW